MIMYGGDKGAVFSVTDEKFLKPYKLHQGKTAVQRLEFALEGKALLVFSLDFMLTIIFIDNEVARVVEQAHDGTVISGDLCKTAVATIGCDGYLNISEVKGTNVGEAVSRQ